MSHPACQHSLECLTRERLTMNRARSLLRTRGIYLGYSFEPRHNSRALATGGLVLSIGSSIKDARTRGNQFDQFGLRRPHRFDVIQAEPHESSLLFLTQEGKTNFCSHGGYDPLRKCSGWISCLYLNIWWHKIKRNVTSPTSGNISFVLWFHVQIELLKLRLTSMRRTLSKCPI